MHAPCGSLARTVCVLQCGGLGYRIAQRRSFTSAWRPVSMHAVASAGDEVLRSVSDNGQVSVLAVRGLSLVQEACTRHQTAPTAGAALGRALLGSLLLACFRGEGEKTHITFRGDGPLGTMQVIADASGMVKGKVGNPLADPPLRPDGKLNVGAAVGRGVLAVVRSLPFTEQGWQQPYTGMTQLRSGEVAEDLAHYLMDSEQTQSALALGVSINRELVVDAAGGYLIQVLPFAEEETLSTLEANIAAAGSVTAMLKSGATPRDMTERLLAGLGCTDPGFSLTPRYGPCEPAALQGRMRSAVAALGEAEVRSILDEQGQVEVTCEFCKETYQFGEEIMGMVAGAGGEE